MLKRPMARVLWGLLLAAIRSGHALMERNCHCGSLVCILLWATISANAQTESANPETGAPDAAATVEGTLADRSAAHASVRLERVSSNPLAEFDGYSGTVQLDGSFQFEDVAPGTYRLVAEAPGMLHGEYGSAGSGEKGAILDIKPGGHLRGLSISLFPDPPVICGRVLDANGSPLTNVTVEAYTVIQAGDGPFLSINEPSRLTSDSGNFSFPGLFSQGQFYLRVNGVWYPSTQGFSEARPLAPAPASRAGCTAEIRIPESRCVGDRVIGDIQTDLDRPLFEYEATLDEVRPSGVLFVSDKHPVYRAGSVEFTGVCAGRYQIVVRNSWLHGHPNYFASQVFEVHAQGVTTVPIIGIEQKDLRKSVSDSDSNQPLASIDGQLTLDGLDRNQACPSHVGQQISLMREGDLNALANSGVDASGHFRFDNLRAGIYRLSLGYSLHGAVYIERFSAGSRSADPRQLNVMARENLKVEAVLSNDPTRADGHISATAAFPLHLRPPGTHPAASLSGTLVGPDASSSTVHLSAIRFNSDRSLLYSATVAADGTFRFGAVDPGIYVLSSQNAGHTYTAWGAKGPGLEGKPVILMAGQRARGYTFSTSLPVVPDQLRYAKSWNVSGLVPKMPDHPSGTTLQVLLKSLAPESNAPAKRAELEEDGTFTFHGIRAGGYLLSLVVTDGGRVFCSGICYGETEHLFSSKQIMVVDQDLTDLRLEAQPPPVLNGELLIDGKAPGQEIKARWSSWIPSLSKVDNFERPMTAKLDDNGHFSFGALDAVSYNVYLNNFWPDYYVQSILLNGAPIVGTHLSLGFGQSAHLTIRISTDAASGILRSEPSKPPIDPFRDLCQGGFEIDSGMEWLMIPDALPDDNSGLVHARYVSSSESRAGGVPPGKYRVVAFSNFAMTSHRRGRPVPLYTNHDFLQRLGALGKPVVVTAGQQFDFTAPLVTEQIQEVLADMGLPKRN